MYVLPRAPGESGIGREHPTRRLGSLFVQRRMARQARMPNSPKSTGHTDDMKIRARTTHDEDATLPENVAEALGLQDGDEVEVVVRGGERLLRRAGGRAPLTVQVKLAPGTYPDQPTGKTPDTERVLLLTQSLLADFAQLGEARRGVLTAQVMRELRGYDEYDEALPEDSGEPG